MAKAEGGGMAEPGFRVSEDGQRRAFPQISPIGADM